MDSSSNAADSAMTSSAPVVIADYSPEWPAQFAAERRMLARLLPGGVIEHIGSTSVPGLAAKPIIDIMIGVSVLSEAEARISSFESLGYRYCPEHEQVLPQRRFFSRSASPYPLCHIHAVVKGSPFWTEHLAFRDTLRDNAGLAAEYAALKYRLAGQFRGDRAAYTDAKASFIQAVLASGQSGVAF